MAHLIRWLVVLTTILTFAGCGNSTPPSNQSDGMLRRGLSGEPVSLDPGSAADTFAVQIIQDLYEGLLREGPNGEIIPGVASSWTVAADGITYQFQLRPNARWSNGQPVRAQDFVNAWQRVVDPKRVSLVANDLRIVAGASEILAGRASPASLGIVAANDNELIIKLEQSAPYFPQVLAHPSAFPIFSDASARSHDPQNLVSNGAYALSDWRPGASLDLIRSELYWDRAQVKIQRVHYQITPDQYAQFAAYRAGQLDLTDTIPSNALSSLRKENPSEVVIAPFSAVAYYGLNMTMQPFGNNLKLRNALSMAIDRRRLVSALGAGQVPAFTVVPPGTWNYASVTTEWSNLTDAEREASAKRLYREAGFSTDRPLRLRMLLNSNPSIKQTATLVAAMWREELGIETILTDEEFRVFLQSRRDKQRWDVVRLSWNADYNDASNFLDIFRSDSTNNDTGYSDASFDATLDTAAHTLDPEARRAALESAEKIILRDAPAIPIYFFVSKHLVKPYVIGYKPNPTDRTASQSLSMISH